MGVIPEAQIADALTRRAEALREGTTFCPSEVARDLAEDWRPLMAELRRVAAGMEELTATQGGVEVDPINAKGPIRLGRR